MTPIPSYAPQPSDDQIKLLDDLGGSKAVADALNSWYGTSMTGQCVSNWKARGIPYRVRGRLVVMAGKRVAVPKDFFGIEKSSA